MNSERIKTRIEDIDFVQDATSLFGENIYATNNQKEVYVRQAVLGAFLLMNYENDTPLPLHGTFLTEVELASGVALLLANEGMEVSASKVKQTVLHLRKHQMLDQLISEGILVRAIKDGALCYTLNIGFACRHERSATSKGYILEGQRFEKSGAKTLEEFYLNRLESCFTAPSASRK